MEGNAYSVVETGSRRSGNNSEQFEDNMGEQFHKSYSLSSESETKLHR